jgi:hypothetical protein
VLAGFMLVVALVGLVANGWGDSVQEVVDLFEDVIAGQWVLDQELYDIVGPVVAPLATDLLGLQGEACCGDADGVRGTLRVSTSMAYPFALAGAAGVGAWLVGAVPAPREA